MNAYRPMETQKAEDSSSPTEGAPSEAASSEMENYSLDCHSGDALSISDVSDINSGTRGRIVLIAGDPESGKTSLIAALFQLFLKGPVATYNFAGSRSLVGFDQRCFLARTDSGNPSDEFERTIPNIEKCILHLRVAEDVNDSTEGSNNSADIFFSDISGEEFREAQNNLESCQKLRLLVNADRLVVLVDGAQIQDRSKRQSAKNSARTIIRSALDSGALLSHVPVDVLFTKWDLIEGAGDEGMAASFAEELKEDFLTQFGHRLTSLNFHKVSAVPEKEDFILGWGLDAVFPDWVEHLPEHNFVFSPEQNHEVEAQFDKFDHRKYPSIVE